jgi:hypothetical protein
METLIIRFATNSGKVLNPTVMDENSTPAELVFQYLRSKLLAERRILQIGLRIALFFAALCAMSVFYQFMTAR